MIISRRRMPPPIGNSMLPHEPVGPVALPVQLQRCAEIPMLAVAHEFKEIFGEHMHEMFMIARLKIEVCTVHQAVIPNRLDSIRAAKRWNGTGFTVNEDLAHRLLGRHAKIPLELMVQRTKMHMFCGRQDGHHELAMLLEQHGLPIT
jgi:hypothetical protein